MRIGIDLGGTKIEIVALEQAGNRAGDRAEDAAAGAVLARERIPTPRGDYDATIAAIRRSGSPRNTVLPKSP